MWPVIVAGVVVQVRRWHDINASGWWVLLNAIPYLGHAATIIVCGFIPGTRGLNRFGPDPLGRTPRPQPPLPTPGDRATTTVVRQLDQHEEQRTAKQLPPSLPTPPLRVAASSLESELRSLAALKADGIISEEEFTAKKRTLLGL
jgi:hypothetical protein